MIKYNAPELEVITFTAEDIITASGAVAPAPAACPVSPNGHVCEKPVGHTGIHKFTEANGNMWQWTNSNQW